MKKIFFTLIASIATLNIAARPLIWDVDALKILISAPQSKEYKDIIARANSICMKAPISVTEKTECHSGDKHNYESLSIYYWPNPSDPKGPYIVKDGETNPECKNYDQPRLSQLNYNTHWLAQAYFLTHERTFYEAFVKQIDTWFITPSTRMNPNFEYSQFIPGKNNGKGCAAGLIDAYNFIDVIESIELVNEVNSIGRKRIKSIKKWFKAFSQWMQESEQGKAEEKATNNHGTAYDITLYYFSQYIGNKKTCKNIVKNFASKRINPQINEDGKQPEELKRTKAFHYSVYNIEHLVAFCKIQSNLGNDYINKEGYRIKLALNYLQQFVGQKESFPYQEIGDWSVPEQKLNNLLHTAKILESSK